MKKIRTVCGDIAPEELGFTSMHDHTFLSLAQAGAYMQSLFPQITQEMVKFKPENYGFLKTGTYLMSEELQDFDDMELLVKEYRYFKEMGGNSVCSPTVIGIRRDIRKDVELSERTGLNFINATGLYHETSIPDELRGKDEEFYYQLFKNEVENGIDGTEVKPGVLKASLATCSDVEVAVLNACVRLTAETGMSTHVHTEPSLNGDEIVRVLDEATARFDVSPERILVCHMDNRIAGSVKVTDYLLHPEIDRTLDLELQKKLLAKGYNIGLDTWGMPVTSPYFFMADDFERLKALVTLIDLGYGSQITLGNDFSSKLQCRTYGGYGCTRFIEFGLAMLDQLGRKADVQKLVYENPARILAF